MQTTSNAAVDQTAEKTAAEKAATECAEGWGTRWGWFSGLRSQFSGSRLFFLFFWRWRWTAGSARRSNGSGGSWEG